MPCIANVLRSNWSFRKSWGSLWKRNLDQGKCQNNFPTLFYPTLPHPSPSFPTLPYPIPYPTLPYSSLSLPFPLFPSFPSPPLPFLFYPTLPHPSPSFPTLPYPIPYPTLLFPYLFPSFPSLSFSTLSGYYHYPYPTITVTIYENHINSIPFASFWQSNHLFFGIYFSNRKGRYVVQVYWDIDNNVLPCIGGILGILFVRRWAESIFYPLKRKEAHDIFSFLQTYCIKNREWFADLLTVRKDPGNLRMVHRA